MIRLALKLGLAAAALWAVFAFVPVRGRTLAARWDAAASPSEFVDRAVAELTGGDGPRGPSRPQARQKPGPAQRPVEGHTEADRRAVDRILSEHLAGER